MADPIAEPQDEPVFGTAPAAGAPTAPTGTDPAGTDPAGTDPAGTDPAETDEPGADPAETDEPGADPAEAAHESGNGPAPRGGRIVVGVDGSDPSIEALRWAARQASLTGASLEAVMAWELPGGFGWGGLPGLPEDMDMEQPAAHALADAVAKALTPEQAAAVDQVVVMGNAAGAILDRGKGAELIVVGVRGHGTFRATLLGSVSHTVTLHASCPVVVVRGSAAQASASGG